MRRPRLLIERALLAVSAVIAVGLLQACSDDADPHTFSSTVVDPASSVTDIRLTELDSTPYVLSEDPARLTVVYFGYTHCPDVCPTTMADLRTAMDTMPADRRDDITVVMVTLDPERDTAEVMDTYVNFFDDSFVGLSGPPEQVHQLMDSWDIEVTREESTNGVYFLSHPAHAFVVDNDTMELRLLIPFGLPGDAIAADLLGLLEDI